MIKKPTNDEMLILIRNDRKHQTIKEVIGIEDHPQKRSIDGLLYEVEVIMDIPLLGISDHLIKIPYPHKPYQLWLKEMFRRITKFAED